MGGLDRVSSMGCGVREVFSVSFRITRFRMGWGGG